MLRETFDRQIKSLTDKVVILEGMVRMATLSAVDALKSRDQKLSRKIYEGDKKINALRFEIENETLIAIATQQPMASDLRNLASILEIITELERIGDYAKGIAKINLLIKSPDLLPPIDDLPEMTKIATDMLQKAVTAFVNKDVETARKVPDLDDKVDEFHNKIYFGLIEYMTQSKESADLANHLQWAVHNIERLADRVTNICERTIFVATGDMNELEESDDEFTI